VKNPRKKAFRQLRLDEVKQCGKMLEPEGGTTKTEKQPTVEKPRLGARRKACVKSAVGKDQLREDASCVRESRGEARVSGKTRSPRFSSSGRCCAGTDGKKKEKKGKRGGSPKLGLPYTRRWDLV